MLKKFSITALVAGLIFVILSIIIPFIMINDYIDQNGSIGIIGGADTPTIHFIMWQMFGGYFIYILILGILLTLSGSFCLIFGKTILENCSLRTTVISLLISVFGAQGLVCFLNWFIIVSFHEMSKSPIAYPLNITLGIISLLALIIFIYFYIKARKENLKIKGIVIDILTSIITLPIFFLSGIEIYALLKQIF